MRIEFNRRDILINQLVILSVLFFVLSCSQHTAKRAGEGAASGALIGGVGGLVTGLVFGGDPMESAARGAVYGASTGAAAGAIAGSQENKHMEEQKKADHEKLQKQIGPDAYNGIVALTDCKHEIALVNAQTAAKDKNRDFSLAGLWLEVLTYADNRNEDKARELFPTLIREDDKLSSVGEAEESMRQALNSLMDIREANNLPRVCD